MLTWIMPHGAHDLLASVRTGPRNLLSAIAAAGNPLFLLPWNKHAPDLSVIPPQRSPFVLYGGHSFLQYAQDTRPDLAPGVFCSPEKHAHDAVCGALGDMALNADAVPGNRDAVLARVSADQAVFVRPVLGNKAFSGTLIRAGEAAKAAALPDVPMVIGTPRDIVAEYRFIILDGEVITGSQYIRDGRIDVRVDFAPDCAEFAEVAAALYAPDRIFTCDVAETPDGPKVVEYNSFSSSGLYACDGREIVRAVRTLIYDTQRVQPNHPFPGDHVRLSP